MIVKYIGLIMGVITLVSMLAFCEEPSYVQQQPTIIQKKEQAPRPQPETHADPEGMSGLF